MSVVDSLVDIVRRRLADRRREEVARDAAAALQAVCENRLSIEYGEPRNG